MYNLTFTNIDEQESSNKVKILNKEYVLPKNVVVTEYGILNFSNKNLDINLINNINNSISEFNQYKQIQNIINDID
jgi:hypothetical protein